MDHDVVIVGAGPAGLCFARSLAGTGLRVALVEARDAAELADPPFDGREIALTHHSAFLLRRLGAWERLPAGAVHVLRDAQVLNGDALPGLELGHEEGDRPELGYLVANQLIRRAAWESVAGQQGLRLLAGLRVVGLATDREEARVRLSDGQGLSARLVVAADSRFSETRRAMGIPADMHDFGRTMMVCRMHHDEPHRQVAWEWFDYGQTLALLPLAEHESSVVVTLPHVDVERLVAMPDAEFGAAMEARFHHRLGRMHLVSTRHAYPLVGVYPRRFVAGRFAVIGDAAVGMHPVTAHGFNFGLLGQDLLARAIQRAQAAHADIAAASLLSQYERELRRATRPLYLATRAIALLYTDDSGPARLLRTAGLQLGARLPGLRRAMIRGLVAEGDSQAATYPLLGVLRAIAGPSRGPSARRRD